MARTRRRNPELRDVHSVGPNMIEAHHGLLHILFSYKTPVAILAPSGIYKTEKFHSNTTSKHIAKWIRSWNLDPRGAAEITQEGLEYATEHGIDPERLADEAHTKLRNPGGQLRFDEYPLRDDKRKKSPPKYSFYQLTLEDVLAPNFGREQLYVQDDQGFMARVRRNGQVKTWKRDPERVEIPVKFGMYEAFRITDPSELFVMATDFPINVDPTPAETAEVVRRLTRHGNRPRRTKRRMGLIKDMRFFREQSGGVVGEGSRRGLDLARAEREMRERGWVVTWEPDPDPDLSWMSDEDQRQEHEVYVAVLWDRDPAESRYAGRVNATVLGSLGGIVDPSREYMRVVAAELASDALYDFRRDAELGR